MKKFYLLLALLALPALAFANTGTPDAAMQQMLETIMSWTTGPLGVGLATTMLVMGGAMAVAQNSPMPALTGVMGAAFLHFGPGIIMNIMAVPNDAPTNSLAPTAQVLAQSSKAPNAAAGASAAHALQASTAVASTPAAASSVQAAIAAISAASMPEATTAATTKPASTLALTDAQLKKAVAQAPELASVVSASQSVAVQPASDSKSLTSHSSSLAHTVPVPEAVHPHAAIKAPAVSSSQVTKWVGLGGAAIILTLLGLLMYLSAQRRARASGGFTPSGSTTPTTPTSVFSDPHGFKREKRSPTFGHESA